MEAVGRSCVKTKKFSFTQQIEKFPWQLRRGAYISPKYYCESANCNWSLIIRPKRKSLLGIPSEYIEVSLRREDYKNQCQSVDVNLVIMDSSSIGWNISVSKEIHFTPSSNEEFVSRFKKNELFHGYFRRLNRVRFIPNDILTLKCEITVYETTEENYESEAMLEDTTTYAKKEFFKVLQSYFGIMMCLLALVCTENGFRAGVFIIIAARAIIAIVEFLVVALKKLWKFVNPDDDIIYNKPRKPTINQQ